MYQNKYRALAAALLLIPALQGQVCRISVTGLNQNRRVAGPVSAECPPTLHTTPFGNWGVTSNFGQKNDGRQFEGWCRETRVCDNEGNCSTQCRDGWFEWNSCTTHRQWAPRNCTLFNHADCTQQSSPTGLNVHGNRTVDIGVRCPTDTNGDRKADGGGCADAAIYRSGVNFMSLYEMDPGTTDDLIQTVYYPEAVMNLDCNAWGCTGAVSSWLEPNFYDSPATPAIVYAQLAVRIDSAVFVDTSRACAAVSPTLKVLSGANYVERVAPDSVASIFGDALSTETRSAPSVVLPTDLGGVTVTVTDSAGVQRSAPLAFVSATQVNMLVPATTAIGQATVSVRRGDNITSTGTMRVNDVAPGLISANASGSGVASATAVRINAAGQQSPLTVFRCAAQCTAVPIDVASHPDSVYLSLYGSGLRRQPTEAKVVIGGTTVQPVYAGPQGEYAGLDQINVLVPRSLRGRGLVEIVIDQGGVRSNAVTVAVQ
ncbi:MAG TPA: hypothetical protein VES20_03935 [Bryobacteraceae bacterium]|nr:hypothetical protein [Bryobacteraceae bacterium]